MKDNKLNNLLDMKSFSEKEVFKASKQTKRTEVGKDVLLENTGKDIFKEKAKSKEEHAFNKLNNLVCLDDFSADKYTKKSKPSKRTEVGKDILQEKKSEKKSKDDDCDDDCDDDDEEEKPKGLTAKQKKLPKALQQAILKRQNKK